MKTVKKILRYLLNAISILAVVVSVVLMVSVFFSGQGNVPNVFGYSLLRVLTGSMEPEIPTNSLIIIKKTEASELQVGDVISFYSKDPQLDGMVNTHRVTRIENQGAGAYTIYTKGDANSIEDAYTTDQDHLLGKVVWKSLILGTLIRLISNPLVFVPIIIAPLLFILIYHIRQVVKATKELSKEQEKAYEEALEKIKEKKRRKKAETAGAMSENDSETGESADVTAGKDSDVTAERDSEMAESDSAQEVNDSETEEKVNSED